MPHTAHLVAAPGSYDTRPSFAGRLAALLKRLAKKRAQAALRQALALIGLATTRRDSGGQSPTGTSVRRILVVRVDLLGDTVLSLPAVRALRRAYPAAAIDMLVQPSTAGILAGDPDLAEVIAFNPHVWRSPAALVRPGTWRETLRVVRRLRASRYDLAISVSGDIGSIVTRLSGARRRFGYATEAYRHFLTDPVPGGRYLERRHEVQYVLALAQAAGGVVAPEDVLLRLHVQPEAAHSIARLLQAQRDATGARGPVIVLHPGAQNGQAKRWPAGHLAALAGRLSRELDAMVVLTGAAGDAPLVRAILRHVRVPVANLVGQTSLPELVALLAASDLVISGDSGPVHIACAVQTPVVALYGPTDPAMSGPTAPDAIVLRAPLWCAPCYDASETADCRFHNPVCMKRITPDAVFQAARRQLRLDDTPAGRAEGKVPDATTAAAHS
jgi:lipopolysaccharide heptosyltransferase II